MMKKENLNVLLPNRYKLFSIALIPSGVVFLIAYLKGIKPEWLNIKVFALASTYAENRYVQVVQTNAMDEIGVSLFVAGLFLLVFTEEKKENDQANQNRLKAFVYAAKTTFIIWLACYWLFFGYIIFPISMAFFVVHIVVYYLIFRYLQWILEK